MDEQGGQTADQVEKEEKRESRWPKVAIFTLITVIILLLILILILYFIRSPLFFRSSASTSVLDGGSQSASGSLSLDNSYIFASPLRAKTGGEKIRVTVFILDTRGLGLSGRKVSIGGGDALNVTSIQPTTDGQGRATFDVSSESTPGVYIIQASVDGLNLVQQATISFD